MEVLKDNSLISVIVPVYDVEKYINRCVNSIVNQTYKNLEIILVDDGSPDNCPQMCDEWAEKDKRIKVIHKENGGLSSARNSGLDIMTGDYVYFVDSDDYITDNAIALLYDSILQNGADMSFARFYRLFEDDTDLFQPEFTNSVKVFNKDDFWRYYYSNSNNEYSVNMIVSNNKLISGRIFDNLRFETGRINEDVLILLSLIERCERIVFSDTLTYYYFQNELGIISKNADRKNIYVLNALADRVVKFANENKEYTLDSFREYFWYFRWFYFDNKSNKEMCSDSKTQYKKIYKLINKYLAKEKLSKNFLYYSLYKNEYIFRLSNAIFNRR